MSSSSSSSSSSRSSSSSSSSRSSSRSSSSSSSSSKVNPSSSNSSSSSSNLRRSSTGSSDSSQADMVSSAIRMLRRIGYPGGPGGLLAIVRREDPLPEADGLRRDLDELVFLDVLEGILEGDLAGRLQDDIIIRGRRPHVAQLLFLGHVHVQVAGPGVLPREHALVHHVPRFHEHLGSLLQVAEGKGYYAAHPV